MSEVVSSSKSEFWKLYENPKWQKKRLEVLQRADFRCEECKDNTKNLHVHHRYYKKDSAPWDYPDDCFQCLCRECHRKKTIITEETKQLLGFLPKDKMEVTLGYILAQDLWQKMYPALMAQEKLEGEIKVSSEEVAQGIADFCRNGTRARHILHACTNGKISAERLFDLMTAGF